MSALDITAAALFAAAVLHTFFVKQFQHLARRHPAGSVAEKFFHLLGNVELVFGLWAGLYLLTLAASSGPATALRYLESRRFAEPLFVVVILAVCSMRPILSLANALITVLSRLLPARRPLAFYCSALVIGPLLGSFITEPAAMTVTAMLLLERFYGKGISVKLKYATLGLLFVNVSIGGVLTPYAAPPVLMVATSWGWDLPFMLTHFGWRGALACSISTAVVAYKFRHALRAVSWSDSPRTTQRIPHWVSVVHLLVLLAVVLASHRPVILITVFLSFFGLNRFARKYQQEVKLREALGVGFFLGGLVVLGGPQAWWLERLLSGLSAAPLYFGAIALTAITDNAALTYLGSLVPDLSDASKYALVAGGVTGGGLTVIANAPNPAGYGILNRSFGVEGISPLGLFLAGLLPTGIAIVCFWLL